MVTHKLTELFIDVINNTTLLITKFEEAKATAVVERPFERPAYSFYFFEIPSIDLSPVALIYLLLVILDLLR